MSINNEIETYNRVTPTDYGEVEIFDDIIFPIAIRKRELDIILHFVQILHPQKVLDFGCGGGWLTKNLSIFKCNVVGIDIAKSLLFSAKKVNPSQEFVVANCTNLPFIDKSFDLIIGIGILHHLNISMALTECYRLLKPNGLIIFMEPNAMNPIMAIGRKIVPSEIHTKDERAIYPNEILRELLRIGYDIESIGYFFPFSFCISYFLAKTESKFLSRLSNRFCNLIIQFERTYERIPLQKKTAGVITIIAKK